MTVEENKQLQLTACKVRLWVFESIFAAKAGHPGGSLSIAEAVTYLYFREMNIDPKNPDWPDRDRFVLSKGHAAPALYAALALRGYFPVEDLMSLRKIDSYLQGHPNMNMIPGVDMSTGSLGQGVSAACGMALAAKKQGKALRVYAILGDGEIQEGEVWEALMFAAHYKLDNLCLLIDNNGLQIDGNVKDVMSPYPIIEKAESFGCGARQIDGSSFEELESAFGEARATKGKPFVINMKTVKGHGVSFMENKVEWHGKAPGKELYETGIQELRERLAEMEGR